MHFLVVKVSIYIILVCILLRVMQVAKFHRVIIYILICTK